MEAHQLVQLEPNPNIEEFQPGDTVRVEIRVTEGERTRLQALGGHSQESQSAPLRSNGSGSGHSQERRRPRRFFHGSTRELRNRRRAYISDPLTECRVGQSGTTRQSETLSTLLPAWSLRARSSHKGTTLNRRLRQIKGNKGRLSEVCPCGINDLSA